MSKWLYGRNLSSFRMILASYIVLLYIVLCSYAPRQYHTCCLVSYCVIEEYTHVYTQELAACLLQSYNFYIRKLLIILSRSEFAKQSELEGIGGAVSDISRTAGSFQSPPPTSPPGSCQTHRIQKQIACEWFIKSQTLIMFDYHVP